ncbi:protein Wnt-11 isoform X3 [Corvus cornix cornix]|uniref:protein Wnt-11 isoform X3 n=1 Tax=Corvus cornix cornix TaxID=932674 RepID=UPI000900DE80|nr:protein Wnt-11 isoform X3 [Corvus cornix cornix]
MLIRADITPHIKADGAAYKAAPGAVPSERTRSSRSLARVEVISFGKQEKVEKMKPSLQFFLAGFLLLILQTGLCYGIKWIGLSKTPLALTLNQTQHCKQLEGLVVSQVQLCRSNLELMQTIIQAAREVIKTCRKTFSDMRWNCSSIELAPNYLLDLERGTRESAFVYALSAAAISHTIARACTTGDLPGCSCGPIPDAPMKMKKSGSQANKLMHLHNSEVGRQVLKASLEMKCKCHGVSGSCSIKTCWKGLQELQDIALDLKNKYLSATKVVHRPMGTRKYLVPKDIDIRPVKETELIYLQSSPDFCMKNEKVGSHGTQDRSGWRERENPRSQYSRQCNKTSNGSDSCDLMCCGRGYNPYMDKVVERCHCKYHWCCYVTCKKCERTVERYVCK